MIGEESEVVKNEVICVNEDSKLVADSLQFLTPESGQAYGMTPIH